MIPCPWGVSLADPTGFEPAVSGVTGRRVRPLHYGSRRAYRLIGTARGNIPQPRRSCQHTRGLNARSLSGKRPNCSLLVTRHCLQGFGDGFIQGERLTSRERFGPHLLAQRRSCRVLMRSDGRTLG